MEDASGTLETDHAVFSCRTCDTVVLGPRDYVGDLRCCDGPLYEVTESSVQAQPPTIETLAQDVFGLPKNGFDICLCTVEQGAATVSNVAERLGYERSVITRYLNRLSERGLLQKTARIREGGGEINVYYPLPVEELNRETILSLYLWSASAADVLRETNDVNADMEADADQTSQKLATLVWD